MECLGYDEELGHVRGGSEVQHRARGTRRAQEQASRGKSCGEEEGVTRLGLVTRILLLMVETRETSSCLAVTQDVARAIRGFPWGRSILRSVLGPVMWRNSKVQRFFTPDSAPPAHTL